MTAKRTRRADRLRQDLEEEIFAGTLMPGTRLDEAKLAARFEVSRTPVREALMQLATAGLVELRPRQGAVVRAITVTELMHLFEAMAEMEALCARFAARRMTPAERGQLAESHEECAARAVEGDPNAYYDANRDFHELIYRGARNPYLEETTRSLRNRLNAYRRFQLGHPGRLDQSLAEHRQVIDAIETGDAEAAAERMRAHVAIQGDLFTDLVSTLPPGYVARQSA